MRKNEYRLVCLMLVLLESLFWGCQTTDIASSDNAKMPIKENLQDGIYSGSWKGEKVCASVEVKILAHGIVRVNILEHETLLGKKAEILTTRVIEKQTIELDAVSGATRSSKVILKAAEQALNKALKTNCDSIVEQ